MLADVDTVRTDVFEVEFIENVPVGPMGMLPILNVTEPLKPPMGLTVTV